MRFVNVFNLDKYEYLSYAEFKTFLEKADLPWAPILEEGYLLENDIPKLMEKATRRSVLARMFG